MMEYIISGNLVDVHSQEVYPATITIKEGKISSIERVNGHIDNSQSFIMPGFIDSHCHIESSMLNPIEFGRNALNHGTLASISDPHEIANVCGVEGLEYMCRCADKTPMKIFYSLPSCVPAVDFDTAGAVIDASTTAELIKSDRYIALSEMMNVPGVLYKNSEVVAKLEAAKAVGKPIDGHAPGLSGENLKHYVKMGISTDHEATTLKEAEDKIAEGMMIQIREGSSAKSLNTLTPLIDKYPNSVLLCTDDYKAYDLKKSYINRMVKESVKCGCNIFNVLKAATLNAVEHYSLPLGLLREGDDADFIIVNNLSDFKVEASYIKGEKVSDLEFSLSDECVNSFEAEAIEITDISEPDNKHIIGIIEDSLYTKHLTINDVTEQLNKIICYNRYEKGAKPTTAFIEGLNLRYGAFGSTVGHDSHNITVAGYDNESIAKVVNAIVEMKGGMAVWDGRQIYSLPLPVGGLMSNKSIDEVSEEYMILHNKIKELGCSLTSPLMTLAFMSLPVIPALKLTAKGLFDVDKFKFVK